MLKKIKNALISLSDKNNLLPLLKTLKKNNVRIISSGGTYKSIKKLGFKCLEVSSYTGFKEMLDGRVKTLHPKIHAGILYDRSKGTHKKQMAKLNFLSIDLVIVNFYPFQKVIKESNNVKKVIESIDIGGPTMVRAAAKNYKDVLVITGTNDYISLIQEMEKYKGRTSLKYREHMSSKAFGVTAYYDAVIANWFNKKLKIDFPERKIIYGKKINQLRYGENPHQKSSIYSSDYDKNIIGLKQLGGKELSYNNYNDIFSSLKILLSIKKKSSDSYN
jgi:phosphoribosylaminoimidazolecarboxamide formyltransferase/IMP cyclohydrolase